MAPSKKTTKQEYNRPQAPDLLNSFLLSVEKFVDHIRAQSVQVAAEGEQQILIQSTGESLVGQMNKLTAFIRETADRLSPVQRTELDKFLQVQDGVELANRAGEVATKALARGLVGNLLHWISQHLKELKKILSEILHLIFDLLHITYPDWLDRLLQIIDQILDLLLSLLGEVFGIDFGRTARQLSEQEVNFLREWAAFESVRVVRAGARPFTQEENK